MKDAHKSGFFKSLFSGGRRVAPARADLPLYIPVAPKPAKVPPLDFGALVDELLRHDYAPVSLFREMVRLLEKSNPQPLAGEQRAHCTHMLVEELNRGLSALFKRFVNEGSGVPESREQREGMSHAVRAVEQLAISYKLAFRQEYSILSDDPAQCEGLTIVVLRIMELIRLEQLLRAFRYQKLPQHAWRDSNQLFFAVAKFGDVRAAHSLKIRIFENETAPQRGLFPANATLEQVYLSIQITGLLDVISWPTHLMYIVDRYLVELDPRLTAVPDEEATLPPGHVVIYQNQGVPPRFSRSHDELGDTLLVDMRPLVRRAATDRVALNAPEGASALSGPLSELDPHDRIPILDLLLQKVRPQKRGETRQTVFEARDARVYGGFNDIYRFLRSAVPGNGAEAQEERRFWDSLAMHSKVVAGDGDEIEPRWIVANESESGVQLRIQESQYAMLLQVGRLVAYIYSGEDAAAAKLGYIVRLQRVGEREVEVGIARIRQTATAVVVEDLDAEDQRTLPAVMIRDTNGKLQLLCDNKYGFMTGDRLAVHANGHPYTGALGEAGLIKTDFTVFELHTAE